MSTLAHGKGVELFVSDIEHDRVRQITQGSGFSGLGGVVRFDVGGTFLRFSKITGEQGGPLFNSVSDVRRVDLATGVIQNVATGIVGEVVGIARDGASALVMRQKGVLEGGAFDRQLIAAPVIVGVERVLVDGGKLHYGRLSALDDRVLVLRDIAPGAGTPLHAFGTLAISGGPITPIRGTGTATLGADVSFR